MATWRSSRVSTARYTSPMLRRQGVTGPRTGQGASHANGGPSGHIRAGLRNHRRCGGKRSSSMSEANKSLIRQIVADVINAGDLTRVDTFYAPDYVYHGPGGLQVRGPGGLRELLGAYLTALPDL